MELSQIINGASFALKRKVTCSRGKKNQRVSFLLSVSENKSTGLTFLWVLVEG